MPLSDSLRISTVTCLATAVLFSTTLAKTQAQSQSQDQIGIDSGVPIKNGINNHDNDTGVDVGKPILLTPEKDSSDFTIDWGQTGKSTKSEKPEIDDSKLYPHYPPCASWVDDNVQTKMAVLCIHGLGLNTDAFNSLGTRLAKQGIATYAIDVRGFGSWLKNRNHEQLNFKATVGDIGVTLQAIKAANKNIPLFLLGESMGGAIALKGAAVYQNQLTGLISSAPSGERYDTTKTDIKVAVEFLTGPGKQFDIGKSIIDQATKDKQLRKVWEGDPLNRQDLSADQLLQFQAFMNKAEEAAKKINVIPVLILQGTLDKLVKPEGTWQIFNHIQSVQKTFIALPSEHLVLEDGQTKSNKYDERASKQVANWMQNSQLGMFALPGTNAISKTNSELSAKMNQNVDPAPVKIASSATPQILIFTAPWCAQCAEVSSLVEQATARFGKLAIRQVDVDKFSESDENLAKQLQIGPLPTYVFVRADGTVDSTLIGRSGPANFLNAAARLAR